MINPDTLTDETEEERKERERRTGVLGIGTGVKCYPTGDPSVFQFSHRAVCITKPYQQCGVCPHSRFRLFFDPNIVALKINKRHTLVKCPQWENSEFQKKGIAPDYYTDVELATCEIRPFSFCAQCPSFQTLEESGIDKTQEWFSRWRKYR